jgi:hypothetical protein
MAPAPFASGLPPDLASFAGSPQEWRWIHIERVAGENLRHARFFCALDECTDPKALALHPRISESEKKSRAMQLGKLVQLLERRLNERARLENGVPLACDVGDARDAVLTWSRVQLELLRAAYGVSERALDLTAVEQGFLAFSSGALRVHVHGRRGIGEPDSAFYFSFAEFALLACELGIDAELWEPLLPLLIWTQDVYVHMQRPIGPPPHRFHQFGPRGKERVLDPVVAVAARVEIQGKSTRAELEELHTRNCRDAFGH